MKKLHLQKKIDGPQLFRADSFVAPGCKGNPAGVCLLPGERDEDFYKDIAVKFDHSETAFAYEQDGLFRLRWFTRTADEVDLCGHATLALSWLLWDKGYISPGEVITYSTKSGILTASLKDSRVYMDFPADPVTPLAVDAYPLAAVLGVNLTFMGQASSDILVEIDDAAAIKKLSPDFEALKAVTARGVIVTALSHNPGYDFVSRFFAPAIGIDEDPVTGSAHCALIDYWSKKLHRDKMTGYQASKEGGMVGVSINDGRVTLSGSVREGPVSAKLVKDIGI